MSDRFYSSQEVVSDGTLTQLMVTVPFPEGTRGDLHVFFNGVEDDDRWTWAAPNVNTIIFHDPVPEGETVLVRRLTQMDEVPHIFGEASGATGNSQFSYETIDQNFDFFKRATQDSMDSFTLSGASAEQAKYWAQQAEAASASAEGHRNSASASAASASVSALNAGQSATDAEQSAQAAEGFRDQAEVAKDQAEAAAQSAQGVQDTVEDLRDETLGYRNDAQSSASDAAGSASAAAGSASSASSSAALAGTHATNAQNSASDAANSASQAQTHASNASASASASQTSRLASEVARDESEAARDKAQQWAENPEDVPVEPGQYSAKHWAQKAEEFVGGDAFMRKDQNLADVQDASMSRINLGLGTAATKDTGTGPDEVPTNSDLGTAATRDVGTGANEVPTNSNLGSAAYLPIATTSQAQELSNDATVITPKKLGDAMNSHVLGMGQTWQSVSRARDTNYTNTTGRPIAVSMRFVGDKGTSGSLTEIINVDGENVVISAVPDSTAGDASMFAVIPAGSTYRFTSTGPSTRGVQVRELR